MPDETENNSWRDRLRKLAPYALGAVVVGVLVFAIVLLLGKKDTSRKTVASVVQLKLLPLPPPPPPPPPPKVEPPKIKQPELKVEQPTPQAPAPKLDSPPALDAQGTGPGDAFGLEGRPGGTGWGQGGGGGGGSLASWYAAQINQKVHEEVVRRGGKHAGVQALLQLWISPEGQLERVNVVESSGRAEYDKLLVDSVRAVQLPKPPPGLKQPQWYRFGHRNPGGGLAG